MRNSIFIILLICVSCLLLSCGTGNDSTLDNRGGNLNGNTEDDDDNDNDFNPPPDDDDDDDDNDDNDDNDDDSTYPPYEGDLSRLEVDPGFCAEPAGYTVQFGARGWDPNGDEVQGVYPNWTSLNKTIATIDESGLATTIANGKATIKAQWINSNDMELTATADLWVTGDVFALDQTNGNLVQIDIAKKKIRPEYIIGLTAGSSLSMVIENNKFAAVVVDNQPTGSLEYVSLDIENPYFIDSLDLYDNHRGIQAAFDSYNRIVYLAEPETSDLALFQQNTNFPYFSSLVGVILLRDSAQPISLVEFNNQYLVVLTDNSGDRSRLADPAALYFFDRITNALQLMVPVSITNPKKIDRAFDDQNNEILVTLGGLDNAAGPTSLDFWDESGGNLQSATLATAVNVTASSYSREVWLGDADQPRLYVYGTEEADWIRGLNNPLILPSGSAVAALEMNVSRREIWVANDEGAIFLYRLDSFELKDTYECDGCGIVDLAIW